MFLREVLGLMQRPTFATENTKTIDHLMMPKHRFEFKNTGFVTGAGAPRPLHTAADASEQKCKFLHSYHFYTFCCQYSKVREHLNSF